MPKQYFMPRQNNAFLKWHDNLKANLSATTPGATAADVTQVTADNADLHAKATAALNADNASTTAHALLSTSLANSQKNARALAQRIKKSAAYTKAVGDTLQLEGAEDSTDMTQAAPTLAATAKMGGVVEVAFNKLLAEGVHLYEERGDATGFSYLASETHSPYVDNRPLLVAGKPETRQYKAVFFSGKAEFGLESNVLVVTARP